MKKVWIIYIVPLMLITAYIAIKAIKKYNNRTKVQNDLYNRLLSSYHKLSNDNKNLKKEIDKQKRSISNLENSLQFSLEDDVLRHIRVTDIKNQKIVIIINEEKEYCKEIQKNLLSSGLEPTKLSKKNRLLGFY